VRTRSRLSVSDDGDLSGAGADNPPNRKHSDQDDTSKVEKIAGNSGSNGAASGDLLRGLESTTHGDQK
jgi:hypothetical protein